VRSADSPAIDVSPIPSPLSERGPWLLACAIAAIGVGVLVAVLGGFVGRTTIVAPPPILFAAATPTPVAAGGAATSAAGGAGTSAGGAGGAGDGTSPGGHVKGRSQLTVHTRGAEAARAANGRPVLQPLSPVATGWMEGFYPIYATAQRTFGVNWLLLASIHMQESAFSTAPSTYRGLNFAHCCGGPMQFNVSNGPVTTWSLVSDSYRYGRRPTAYGHMTTAHPSIYDDFDAIMAAAHLLSANGAEYRLDGSAWNAAYAYYGHDATGVTYADQVLARAIGWSQHGFCFNCGVEPAMVQAVHGAYGAPLLLASAPAAAPRARVAATGR
jgi:hypothetical protein